jgi:hypothetical protein
VVSATEPSPDKLSPRLRQTLACLLEGDSEKQVAARLALAIRVISLGSPPCQSGAVTVEGTFAKIKRGRLSVSYNVVSASRVICRQEKSWDEPGAGRDPTGGLVPHDP